MSNAYRHLNDLTGQTFGRLTVLRRANVTECTIGQLTEGPVKWLCQCQCGKMTVVNRNNLITGHTTSCGCSRADFDSKINKETGEKRIRNIWFSMRARCYNPNHRCYPSYGGKGIVICDEWKKSFEAFKDWSLANGYADNLTIDRIDVSKNYCPENCRWITNWEQQQNKSNTIKTPSGLSLRSECIARGLNYNTVRMRLNDGNYTVEEVLGQAPSNKHYYGGKIMEEWCYELGITIAKVKTRMSRKKETFRESMMHYASMANDRELLDFIMNNIPNEKDANRVYYRPRSEEYRIKRREHDEKRKLFLQ